MSVLCGRTTSVLAATAFVALLGACTGVSVDPEAGAYEQLANRVLVYNFAVTPQEVQLDAVGSAITSVIDGEALWPDNSCGSSRPSLLS